MRFRFWGGGAVRLFTAEIYCLRCHEFLWIRPREAIGFLKIRPREAIGFLIRPIQPQTLTSQSPPHAAGANSQWYSSIPHPFTAMEMQLR